MSSKALFLVAIFQLAFALSPMCKHPFSAHNNLCFTINPSTISFGLMSKFCHGIDAHISNIEELSRLRPMIPANRFVLVSGTNIFRSIGTQSVWFDQLLGFHEPSKFIPWKHYYEPSCDATDNWLLLKNSPTFLLYTSSWSPLELYICVANEKKEANIVPQFVEDASNYEYAYHSQGFILKMRSEDRTKDSLHCLVKCLKTNGCKVVYYSKSTELCIICLYSDTFLHVIDQRRAIDFRRYRLTT